MKYSIRYTPEAFFTLNVPKIFLFMCVCTHVYLNTYVTGPPMMGQEAWKVKLPYLLRSISSNV